VGILAGLFLTPPVIHYQGIPYPLNRHKVIVTGNPVYYLGRHFHPVFWEWAYVIWFGQHDKTFIMQYVKKRLMPLSIFSDEQTFLIREITDIFFYLEKQKSCVTDVSLRDINNLCSRFRMLCDYHHDKIFSSSCQYIKLACWDEFNGLLLDQAERNGLKRYLFTSDDVFEQEITILQPTKLPIDNSVILTKDKQVLWRLIEDALFLRELRIKEGSNKSGKLGMLSEGTSGIGKSLFPFKLLELHGLSQTATDTQRLYKRFTAGSEYTEELILTLFDGGSVVCLDELNLAPELEDLMLQLLTGVNRQMKKASKSGFMVFASQNDSRNLGCSALSDAYLDRFHLCRMEAYTEAEFLDAASQAKHPEPEEYVASFQRNRDKYPLMVNTRNFFENLDKRVKDEEVESRSELLSGRGLKNSSSP